MRRNLILGLTLLGASALAGCGDEVPTSVAGEILEEGFRTFEVVLDAEAFLQSDTTYDRLGSLIGVPFSLVANSFGDELFAHTLFRVQRPSRVTYENEEGTSITDTVFTVVGGTLTVVVDSLAESEPPVELQVLEVVESWDDRSVTWELRFDTAGISEPWVEPGGTTDELLGSATWEGGDTLRIPLDSAAAAVFTDSASAFHGGLLRSATPDSRLRIQSLDFDFDVRPETTPDTTVEAGGRGATAVVVFPEASTPPVSELRVGGVPTWRSVLQFRPLSDVRVPCAPGGTTCSIPLSEVQVNLASLLLQPVEVGSRRIERPLSVESRAVLRAIGVPLTRSPLTSAIGVTDEPVAPAAFDEAAAEADRVAVPVTGYVLRNINPREDEDPILWLALLTAAEQTAPAFGYAAFASLQSATPPRLRLIVTVPAEEELQ